MSNEPMSLGFIKSRIQEIRSGLFYNVSEDVFQMPTCIISAMKVDDDGNVWFLMNRNGRQMVRENDRIPAELFFYRKGQPFSLRVKGWASLFTDVNRMKEVLGVTEEIHDASNIFLVRMKMTMADYTERATTMLPKHSFRKWWQKIEEFIYPLKFRKQFSINLSTIYETVPY